MTVLNPNYRYTTREESQRRGFRSGEIPVFRRLEAAFVDVEKIVGFVRCLAQKLSELLDKTLQFPIGAALKAEFSTVSRKAEGGGVTTL